MRRNAEELAKMRKAGRVVAEIHEATRAVIKPGATTADIDKVAREVLEKRGAGSNFLGYDNDANLQRLLRSAMSHRHFPTVREIQQSIHAHIYERVPFIPLWQLPEKVAVHPSLTAPGIDPQRVFANVLDWHIQP